MKRLSKINNNSKLEIQVENDKLVLYGSSAESSGCVLRGALNLQLKKPTRFKSLHVTFTGTISVRWRELLANGYERKFEDTKQLIHHTWTFLSPLPHDAYHNLPAGNNYNFEFEFILPGSLPESSRVDKYYIVQYQLVAEAKRPGFFLSSSNDTARHDIHLSRQTLSSMMGCYADPISIANQWADKIDYEISVPTNTYTYGDTIPVSIKAVALTPNLKVRYVSCIFKESTTCRAVNGWFNGKNKSHSRIIQFIRQEWGNSRSKNKDAIADSTEGILSLGQIWSTTVQIKVPESLSDIQCDAQNDSVRVKHKLKFAMSILNEDGHRSELRAVLPITIAITNSIDGLPAYEEIRGTSPYDPVLMLALIHRRSSSNDNNQENDGVLDNTISNTCLSLPTYYSILMEDQLVLPLPSYRELL